MARAPALEHHVRSHAGGPSRQIRETLSFRDDVSKIVGTHAFKMGYEMLYFRANYFQFGQPSGIFQFDNMTAGLQPNGQPVPNTGNLMAGFELGSVRAGEFHVLHQHLAAAGHHPQPVLPGRLESLENLTLNLGLRWSTESPFHTAHGQMSNFDPTAVDPVSGKMGAIVHPTGGLNNRSLQEFPAPHRLGLAPHGQAGVPRRLRHQHRGHSLPQRAAAIRRISGASGAAARARTIRVRSSNSARARRPWLSTSCPNNTATYVGTNYGSRNIYWMDGNLHPGYVMNWNATVEYQFSTNNLLKFMYQGSAGVHLVESWNVNVFPTDFGAERPGAAGRPRLPRPQNYLPYPQFGSINYMSNTGHSTLSRRHRAVRQSAIRKAWCSTASTLTPRRSTTAIPIPASAAVWRPSPIAISIKARAGYDRTHVLRDQRRLTNCRSARAGIS